MILKQTDRVSAILIALTLFFLPASLSADQPAPEAAYRHVADMVEAGRRMVHAINRAATSGNLNTVRSQARECVRSGRSMIEQARAALEQIRTVVSSDPGNDQLGRIANQAATHLREAIKHGRTAVMHAHHATMSSTLRSGLSHARESAKHARISALYALEGEVHVQEM